MRTSLWAAALGLCSTASGLKGGWIRDRVVLKRQSTEPPRELVYVPQYNFSMPIDHFTESDKRTYNNRFFVNDTYYKPGGPVIFFDFGEAGVSDVEAAIFLADWGSYYVSATVKLAKELNGVMIGWEHRYYGYSNPFPVVGGVDGSEETDSDDSSLQDYGVPVGGAADYKYLTIEQALEDVAYFAHNFNKTQLGVENTVLNGKNATQNLGPYQTPWIWVGGSYPGSRGAWARLRNPDVWYAVWASSAPVQTTPDGSAYFNSAYRGLPKNCTTDIQSVARYVESIYDRNDLKEVRALQTGAALATDSLDGSEDSIGQPYPIPVTEVLFEQPLYYVQSLGIHDTVQKLCDAMEAFNVDQFLSNKTISDNNITTAATVFLYNDGNGKPSDQGIVASHSSGGSGYTSAEIGYAAFLYGVYRFNIEMDNLRNSTRHFRQVSPYEDDHSWVWQVLSEMGLIPNFNSNSSMVLGPKYWNLTVSREEYKQDFMNMPPSDIPSQPNQTYAQSFKGWNMAPSNVMFTNGEFDPWRAFSVMSLDQDLGAPQRKITQDLPKCGEAPAGTDVFGLLYAGAVHAEDLMLTTLERQGAENGTLPLDRGTELFLKAYNAWLPCFNQSRTAPGFGAGTGSTGSGTSAGSSLRPGAGAWEIGALLIACVVYNLF
ncbi:hypothetical protein GQ53DRAFT_744933 [Thozetella sp. PMI_491]|nr:hypothetical protein GQ53DRAFT_744933 [Thozetella sp. PMI_491]